MKCGSALPALCETLCLLSVVLNISETAGHLNCANLDVTGVDSCSRPFSEVSVFKMRLLVDDLRRIEVIHNALKELRRRRPVGDSMIEC